MVGKLVFLVGVLGVGGYFGNKMINFDPAVFPLSKQQAQTMLAGAKTTLPRRDGPGEIKIWSTGLSPKGVRLNMQYASWAPMLTCDAVITPIDAAQSRIVPDCTDGPASDSAIGRTEDELRTPMFEEHIQATLGQRPFNRSKVTAKETATVFKNMGGMQREALQRSQEAAQMQAEFQP